MTLPRITGSRFHRVWQCAASAILPQSTNQDKEAKWEPARGKGKGVHRYLERVRAVGVAQALSEVPPDLLILCKALDIDRLPTHLSTEVAYAWNWLTRTARELGRNLGHRDYDALGVDWSCEIPLTLDVDGWAQVAKKTGAVVRRAYVGDYKTGWTRYPRPALFGQTMLGLLCVASTLDCEDGVVELLHIDDDGDSYPVRDVVDEWDLQTFATAVQETMESLPVLEAEYLARGGGALPKHEGPHCDHCPAFKDCSAKVGLVRSVPDELVRLGVKRDRKGALELAWVPDKDGKEGEGAWALDLEPGAITVRNAAAVYEACERIEAICRRMRTEVCGIAWHEPIRLSDGRVIERYESKRTAVDGKIAAAVLERRYGRDDAMKAVQVKVTLEAIRERVVANIDPLAKPRPAIETRKNDTGLLNQVLAEIKGLGGLTVNVSEKCEPRQSRGKSLPPVPR